MDTLGYLVAIEKRLSVIEDLRRQKGIQSDLIDASIVRIKKLENQFKMCKKPPKEADSKKASEYASNLNAVVQMIAQIEQKVSILEKLYQDVHILQSQTQVLQDNIQEYELKMSQRMMLGQKESVKSSTTTQSNSEKLDGAMENIAILEKEISDLLKDSEIGSLEKRLESMEEWEVVDKQSIQEEMQRNMPQCMTSGQLAQMKVGKGLQRSYSQETTELIAKVDGMKESVEEQKALRMLERENSLEYLDYGGTGGPMEQEAALLLERVDQGFTQIIRDQSESHLMTSLQKELTPEKLESDTSLAEHEKEKLHQQQLIRQIQERQQTDELIEDERKPIEVLFEQPVVHRKKRSCELGLKEQGWLGGDVTVETHGNIDEEMRRLSVEFQRMMMDVGKQTETVLEKETVFMNLLPKGGRIDPNMAFEPIAAMRH